MVASRMSFAPASFLHNTGRFQPGQGSTQASLARLAYVLFYYSLAHVCLAITSWRLGYKFSSSTLLPSSLAVTAVGCLLFPGALGLSSIPRSSHAVRQDQDGPGSRVLSRQLSAFSLQQSLCTPRSNSRSHRLGRSNQGGLAPVRKLLRRVLNSQPPPLPLPSLSRRRQTRYSVDSFITSSKQSSNASDGFAIKSAHRSSLGASPFSSASQKWRPEVARIASGQDLQGMVAAAAEDDSASSPARDPSTHQEQASRHLSRNTSVALTPITSIGAADCMNYEATDPLMRPDISVAVPEIQLLQLGAQLGEPGAQAALRQRQQQDVNCAAGPGPSTFLGPTDDAAQYAEGWEPLVEEHRPGLHYWAWRRYLRKGLFLYKSRTVFEGGVTPPQLAAFNFDWRFKQASDEGCACMHPMLPPGCSVGSGRSSSDAGTGAALFLAAAATCPDPAGALERASSSSSVTAGKAGADGTSNNSNRMGASGGATFSRMNSRASVDGEGGGEREGGQLERALSNGSGSIRTGGGSMPVVAAMRSLEEELEARTFSQSCYLYARTRFPPPMAARQYIYARRVWLKTDDGGCYVVSRGAFDHPCPPPFGGRAVNVEDMVSGYVIRSSNGIYDRASPASEMISLYFEDSHVSPGMVNLAVRKALWPIVQKLNDALRLYQTLTGLESKQGDSKIAKAAAAVNVRSDLALVRHQHVLQRYGNSCGASSTASAPAVTANKASADVGVGAGGSWGASAAALEGSAATAAAAAVAAAKAAAFEEEALILRAFDAGTLLPKQSRGGRSVWPALYRAYLGACSVVGGAARGLMYSARLVLRLQFAAHQAGLAGLRAVVLSKRYAALCAWLQQLAASGGGAGVSAVSFSANGLMSPALSSSSSGNWAGFAWDWLRGRVGDDSGDKARSVLASHPLRGQRLKSFRSHPLRATSFGVQRASFESGEVTGDEDREEGGKVGKQHRVSRMGFGAEEFGKHMNGGGQTEESTDPQQQQQHPQQPRRGGRQLGRRLIAKGATLALRAAALPLMHRALRAYSTNERAILGHMGSGASRQQRQRQQEELEMQEQEEAEAAAQLAKRCAQWLSAVAKSRNSRVSSAHRDASGNGQAGNSNSGNSDFGRDGTAEGDQPELQQQDRLSGGSSSFREGVPQQPNYYAITPPRTPLKAGSNGALAVKPSSSARCLSGGNNVLSGEVGEPGASPDKAGGLTNNVHLFPSLFGGPEGLYEGLFDEGPGSAGIHTRYRRSRSAQFGTKDGQVSREGEKSHWPAMVVDGVPMAPDAALSRRLSARTTEGVMRSMSSFPAGDSLVGDAIKGSRRGAAEAGLQKGSGRKDNAGSSSSSSKQGHAPAKQKLTLSEMGMLHGAW